MWQQPFSLWLEGDHRAYGQGFLQPHHMAHIQPHSPHIPHLLFVKNNDSYLENFILFVSWFFTFRVHPPQIAIRRCTSKYFHLILAMSSLYSSNSPNSITSLLVGCFYLVCSFFCWTLLFFQASCFVIVVATSSFSYKIPAPTIERGKYVYHHCHKLNIYVITRR